METVKELLNLNEYGSVPSDNEISMSAITKRFKKHELMTYYPLM